MHGGALGYKVNYNFRQAIKLSRKGTVMCAPWVSGILPSSPFLHMCIEMDRLTKVNRILQLKHTKNDISSRFVTQLK